MRCLIASHKRDEGDITWRRLWHPKAYLIAAQSKEGIPVPSVQRLRNVNFESGRFSPWVASGGVFVDCSVACAGHCSAFFPGAATGKIAQETIAYPGRCYRLSLRAGTCGGVGNAALTLVLEFLRKGQVIGRVTRVIPADVLPDVCGATPAGCMQVLTVFGVSPSRTDGARISIVKQQSGGSDLLLDEVLLIEQTDTSGCSAPPG